MRKVARQGDVRIDDEPCRFDGKPTPLGVNGLGVREDHVGGGEAREEERERLAVLGGGEL